jgi:hypothetical protein
LPKQIGAYNLDFVVENNLVTLSSPTGTVTSFIPAVNPLLAEPGPPSSPFIFQQVTNSQTIQVAHDVMIDQPLMTEKNLVTVKYSVPAGVTGTFPLRFGSAQNTLLVEGPATSLPLNLSDSGQISIVSGGVPGDYNSNGRVDAADYVVWRNNLSTAFTLPNEVSGVTPGSVTVEDYTAWRARFGNTSGSGAALGLAAAVPEPSVLPLLSLIPLLPALTARRWRRRRRS